MVRPARPTYVSKNAKYVQIGERVRRMPAAAIGMIIACMALAVAGLVAAVVQPDQTPRPIATTPSPYGPPGPEGGAFTTMPAAR